MPTRYMDAPDVREIAEELIRQYHTHLEQDGVRIEYVFRTDTPTKNCREVWGQARKVSSLSAFLAGQETDSSEDSIPPLFVITISRPIWWTLKDDQKRALVDHELCHLWAEEDDKGKMQLSILGHDLEEFRAIVSRYGMWRGDVQQMADAMKQAALPL